MKTWRPILAALLLVSATAQERHAEPRREVRLGSSGRRVALVVGNDNYSPLPRLTNSVHDAKAMSDALSSAGFQVIFLTDASREKLEDGVNRFIATIQAGDVAMFYYSGHAVQIGGENYLSPVDLQAVNEVQARNRSLKAGEVVEEMESRGADLQIVVLDACRDNPFGRERSIGAKGGLAAMTAGSGTFLAFATGPGRTADDNVGGQNGLYTTYLLRSIGQRGLSLEEVFKLAGADVQRASSGKQVPWISSSMRGDFYFYESAIAPPAGDVLTNDVIIEMVKATVPESLILAQIRASRTNFDLTPAEVIRLTKAGVSETMLQQMRSPNKVVAAAPSRDAPPSADSIAAGAAALKAGQTRVNPKDGLAYVWIPPGTFMMGCSPADSDCNDGEKPAHRVTITNGFWLGQTDVTVGAWKRYRAATGKPALPTSDRLGRKNLNEASGNDSMPVVFVNSEEARDFCKWSGGDLPDFSDWEYAARGGSTAARYGNLDDIAWYADNSGRQRIDSTPIWNTDGYATRLFDNGNGPHPVALKRPNAWGLFDMLGNVWQWTIWRRDFPLPAVRGGSWGMPPKYVRVSDSSQGLDSGLRASDIGVRCVWEPTP